MDVVSGQVVPSVLKGLDPEGKGTAVARNVAQCHIAEDLYLQ